jgi:hypothetical protein
MVSRALKGKIPDRGGGGMRILIPEKEVREVLADALGHKPSREELKRFKDYLDVDVTQWLRDNANAFVRDQRGRALAKEPRRPGH